MPDKVTPPNNPAPPPVQSAPKPPGVLPKNAQAYVIAGISVVMISVIALSGGASPSPKKDSTRQPGVIEPNGQRINEYRQRLEEQARLLQEEQARLAQTKQQLGLSSGAGQSSPMGPPYASQAYPAGGYNTPEPRPEKSDLEKERERREYTSLFASNVALSFRKEAPTPVATASTVVDRGNEAPEVAQPLAPESESFKEDGARQREQKNYPELQKADGKQYRLFEGTVMETVLTNRLNSSFSGPVNCLVTTNVWSHDRQHLLVPQGTRVLGEVQRNNQFGQQRLAVFFHRLVMPDGFSVSLDQFKGLNQIGETGLRDQVNHHYGQVFGISLAVGAIAGLANVNTGYGLSASSADAYRQGVSASLSQSSLRILDRYLNVLPTFVIREGHRIKIYLSDDLLLPDYGKHALPSDL